MNTSINKFIVAVLAAVAALLAQFGIVIPWFTPETQQIVATVLGPLLVWLVPNKAPSA